MIRPSRIAAIAWRDLRQEFRGRRGWALPFISAFLLVPAASLPSLTGGDDGVVLVQGAVPAGVAALPSVEVVDEGARVGFERRPDDPALLVHGAAPSQAIRDVLDTHEPTLRLVDIYESPRMPGRSVLLALIAASVLMGAISESIAGERSRKTLQGLLTAAVSRMEVVLGKWAAWGGYGALAAILAGAGAIGFGHMEPGWWLIPLPLVPMATVALGMFMVRHARDVVGGATVTLRVLPAMLSILAIGAWFAGTWHPLLGASVPLGGALIATGATWDGPVPALLATAVTAVATLFLLWRTSLELELDEGPQAMGRALVVGGMTTLAATFCWWVPVTGALMWGPAGNPGLAETLPVMPALLTGALGLWLIIAIGAGRSRDAGDELGLRLPAKPAAAAALALVVGLGLGAVLPWLPTGLPVPDGYLAAVQARLHLGLHPMALGVLPGFMIVGAQEVLFRGWLPRLMGPLPSLLLFALVIAPLDPLGALLLGAPLVGLTHLAKGSVWPAILARVVLGAFPVLLL